MLSKLNSITPFKGNLNVKVDDRIPVIQSHLEKKYAQQVQDSLPPNDTLEITVVTTDIQYRIKYKPGAESQTKGVQKKGITTVTCAGRVIEVGDLIAGIGTELKQPKFNIQRFLDHLDVFVDNHGTKMFYGKRGRVAYDSKFESDGKTGYRLKQTSD